MRISNSIQVASNGTILFFFMAESYSIVYLIQSPVDGHLGCFPVLAIVDRVAMNMQMHVSFLRQILSGYMRKKRLLGHVVVLYIDL